MEKAQLAFLAAAGIACTSWYALRHGYFGREQTLVLKDDKYSRLQVTHTQGLWQDKVIVATVRRVDWSIFPVFRHVAASHPPYQLAVFKSWRPIDVSHVPYEKAESLDQQIQDKIQYILDTPGDLTVAVAEARVRLAITELIDSFK